MKRPAAGLKRPAASKRPAANDVVAYPVCARIVVPDLDRDAFKARIRAWAREINEKPITINLSQNERRQGTFRFTSIGKLCLSTFCSDSFGPGLPGNYLYFHCLSLLTRNSLVILISSFFALFTSRHCWPGLETTNGLWRASDVYM